MDRIDRRWTKWNKWWIDLGTRWTMIRDQKVDKKSWMCISNLTSAHIGVSCQSIELIWCQLLSSSKLVVIECHPKPSLEVLLSIVGLYVGRCLSVVWMINDTYFIDALLCPSVAMYPPHIWTELNVFMANLLVWSSVMPRDSIRSMYLTSFVQRILTLVFSFFMNI